MTIPSKAIYRYNVILIKLSMAVFTELGQTIRNFTWDHKKSRIAKATLWRGEGVRKKVGERDTSFQPWKEKSTCAIRLSQFRIHMHSLGPIIVARRTLCAAGILNQS